MNKAGGWPTKHPLAMRLGILAAVFLVTALATVVGPKWVGTYVLPVVVIVGVVYGAILVMVWVIQGWPQGFGSGMFYLFGREEDDHRPRS